MSGLAWGGLGLALILIGSLLWELWRYIDTADEPTEEKKP